jgi:hypothetical protein
LSTLNLPWAPLVEAFEGGTPHFFKLLRWNYRLVESLIGRQDGCAMAQVLHGSATTTETIRRATQNSQESLRALARRYGINQKTVAKSKKRETVVDRPTGPKDPKSTVLLALRLRKSCSQFDRFHD